MLSSGLLPSFLANIIAILVERPTRRPALAVYVTNVVGLYILEKTKSTKFGLNFFFFLGF